MADDRALLERLLVSITECEHRCRLWAAGWSTPQTRPFAVQCARLRTRFVTEMALKLLAARKDPDQIMRSTIARGVEASPAAAVPDQPRPPLGAFVREHDELLWEYERAVDEAAEPDIHAMLRWQYRALRDAVERLHTVLAREEVGPGLTAAYSSPAHVAHF